MARRLEAGHLVAAIGATLVVALGFANGGYFPTSWGWAALAFLSVLWVGLAVGAAAAPPRAELAFALGLAALVAWTAAAALWVESIERVVLELQREILYLSCVVALLLLVRARAIPQLLGGISAGLTVVASYGVATRLFPERLGVLDPTGQYRLTEPLGYWNALGLLAAMGLVLGLVLAARAERVAGRALAAAGLPVLAATMYFTFSRGAPVALAAGFVAALAFDRRRVQLLATTIALASLSVVGVALASRSDALTTEGSLLRDQVRDGHRLALALTILCTASGGTAIALAALERRVHVGRRPRIAFASAVVGAAIVALALALARADRPLELPRRAYDNFVATERPPRGDLNRRFFTASGSRRARYWRVAWDAYVRHPVAGTGPGTYERLWLRDRPLGARARDAHSLYLETMAELGSVGLALLVLALSIPLAVSARARGQPLAAGAFGVYVAFVAHAGFDWDWEMPVLTLTALAAACALLVAGRGAATPPLRPPARYAGLVLVAAMTAGVAVGLIGNVALDRSTQASAASNWKRSEEHARVARRWAPWSVDALRLLGQGQLAQRRRLDARKTLRRAVELDRGDWRIWLLLAAASDGAERERALNEARERNPLGSGLADFGRTLPRRTA